MDPEYRKSVDTELITHPGMMEIIRQSETA
jgi:hypothetical protein